MKCPQLHVIGVCHEIAFPFPSGWDADMLNVPSTAIDCKLSAEEQVHVGELPRNGLGCVCKQHSGW